MGRIHNDVQHDLIELSDQAWHRRQRLIQPSLHLRHIFPFVAGHGDGAHNGIIQIDGGFFVRARMSEFFHRLHNAPHPSDAVERLKDSLRNL